MTTLLPHEGDPYEYQYPPPVPVNYDPWAPQEPGAVLPTSQAQARSFVDKLGETWPAKLAQSAWSGMTLPGDVYHGKVDMNSDEGTGRALDLAGLMIGAPAGASIPRGAGEVVLGSGAIREAPIAQFRRDAEAIQQGLPDVAEGFARLWRGNRQGEVGKATSFTNDLSGIALPFRKAYGGDLSYVDVPTSHLGAYENTAGTATGAEFNLPPELASRATAVPVEAPQGITVYHGSPHDFDKFDMSKIGTGEGAQAYGHGLYFAGNEGTARSYRDQLRKATLSHPELGDNLAETTVDKAIAGAVRDAAPNYSGATSPEGLGMNITQALKNGDDFDHMLKFVRQSDWDADKKLAWTAALAKGKEFAVDRPPGHMYEARIHADPEHFLDWDKPLSEQHPKVQEAVKPIALDLTRLDSTLGRPDAEAAMAMTGRDLYDKFKARGAGVFQPSPSAHETASALREAGIPGIKYLDAGSRGAGEGSRNYVTFSDDIISILKKYGLAGLGIGTGAGIAHFKMQPAQGDPFQ